ncbi:MAG: ATP-binding protein, partial [bacterium]
AVTPKLIQQLNGKFIQILTGARRTGKTVLLQRCVDHLLRQEHTPAKSIFYFNFDDLELRRELKSDPNLLLEAIALFSGKPLAAHSTPVYLFLDEVQKLPAYFDQLKLYYDTFRPKLRLMLSGSAALEIGSQAAETFAGRIQQTRLFPFSAKEVFHQHFTELQLPSVLSQLLEGRFDAEALRQLQADLLPLQSQLHAKLRQILVSGLLPQAYLAQNDTERMDYLRQYRITYLERDIRGLAQVGNWEDFSRLLNLLILQIGSFLNKTGLSQELGIAQNTVRKYISILEQTFLLEQIEPYTGHVRKNLVKSPKIFFFDSGFFGLVSGLTNYEVLVNSGKIGPIFENFCLNEIRKAMSLSAQFPEIHFWRTTGGAEVDFVIKTDSHLIPVEVKLSDSYGQSDLKNLLKFKATYPKKVDKMILIYNGPLQYSGNIVFLPIWFI